MIQCLIHLSIFLKKAVVGILGDVNVLIRSFTKDADYSFSNTESLPWEICGAFQLI
jgi:hypothetical protein